jgi:DNA replication protein DnaC
VLARDERDAYSSKMARPDCPHCEGSGWKVVERTTEGAQALAADRPGAGAGEPKMVWAVPCDCTTGDRSERALQRARIPERYRHCDFNNFETDNEVKPSTHEELESWNRSLAEAKLLVSKFAKEVPIGTELGILLMGPCGAGKTHLAVAALKNIMLRGHSGLFYDYRELLKEIQTSYSFESQATEMSVLEPVLETSVLLLDDLGASKPSDWVRDTVNHILNARYNAKRVTILTTNFLDQEFSDRAQSRQSPVVTFPSGERARASDKDTLSDRVGARVRSRLYEMCRNIEIWAPDYRKVIRNATTHH